MNHFSKLALILIVFFSLGCNQDHETEDISVWAPALLVRSENSDVVLNLVKPMSLGFKELMSLNPYVEYSDPSYFEIMISDSGIENWVEWGTIEYREDTTHIDVGNLRAGVSYYFKVVSHGRRISNESEPVMIIPGKDDLSTELKNRIIDNRERLNYSPDKKLETYARRYSWEEGNKNAMSVLFRNVETYDEILVEKSAFNPLWAPNKNLIGYISENISYESEGVLERTGVVSVYSLEKDTIVRLTDRYYAYEPSWSKNGEWITYILDSPLSDEYNIWRVNVFTKEKIKVLGDIGGLEELALADDKSARAPVFSGDDTEIIFSRKTNNSRFYPSNLYTVSSDGGKIKQLTNSYWDDYLPDATTDGKFISFISNRTGEPRIWCLSLENRKLHLLQ